MSSYPYIIQKIDDYKSRFYKRRLFIGVLSFFILNICLFLLVSFLEYKLWLSPGGRGVLFLSLSCSFLITLWHFVFNPLLKVLRISKGKHDREAAMDISRHFPEIEDKLLNFLELGQQSEQSDHLLIEAALNKKAEGFEKFTFSSAVNFRLVKKYALIFTFTVGCLLLLSFISPGIVNDSAKRIINYKEVYEKKAPFTFVVDPELLTVFRGDDFNLSVSVVGDVIPEAAVLIINGKAAYEPTKIESGRFSYPFENLQSEKVIEIEAAGFKSKPYYLRVIDRPDLVEMNITVVSPDYTRIEKRSYRNTGSITVLEGSRVLWEVKGRYAEESIILFEGDTATMSRKNENIFYYEKRIHKTTKYEIKLSNTDASNKSLLQYYVDVIEDQYPAIKADFIPDSSTYQFLTVFGSISDDYGFKDLHINYKKEGEKQYGSIPIKINEEISSQSFFATWNLDSVKLDAVEKIEVNLVVRDNDRINGFKRTKSKSYLFEIPTKEDIEANMEGKNEEVQKKLDKTRDDVKELADQLSELEDRLKQDPSFNWQERKVLADIIKNKEEINEQIDDLQKKYQELQESKKKFFNQSPSQIEKNRKFQELMNELMDEDTQKLYEKLKELLREDSPSDQINEKIQELQKKERNMERDLNRATELFKRLKMEAQLENTLQALDSLSAQQKSAAEEKDLENSQRQQKEIAEQFDDFRKNMEKVLEMNQDLKRPEPLEDFEYEERQIAKELSEIEKEL